jgi:leucyl aminopeptidase
MGGAAHALALARLVSMARLPVRLHLLIPTVENAVSGAAYRPGDIVRSRKGEFVEIDNTDAEGRLILADALTRAGEDDPELIVDFATLTGAARTALGPDLPATFVNRDELAADIATAAASVEDPLWRMPLWKPYEAKLASKIADMNNVTTDGFAGSITAALFLKRFVENTPVWVHLDIFAWNPWERPHGPAGGEAQGIRALEKVLSQRFG